MVVFIKKLSLMLKKNLLDLKCNFFSQKKHFTSSQIRACGLGSLTTRYIIFYFFLNFYSILFLFMFEHSEKHRLSLSIVIDIYISQ